jgi:hypothetical protein
MGGDILFILALLFCIGLLLYSRLVTSAVVSSYKEPDELQCPSRAQYTSLGGIVSEPGGKFFTSMDSYSQYYKYLASSGIDCSFVSPSRSESSAKTTPKKVDVTSEDEQTYATTPINKLDDYEFSRVFTIEKESRN